jgi:myosin heavy subunit
MSNLGKVFCVVSIVFSLAAAGFGFMISSRKSDYASKLVAVEDALKQAPAPIQYTADFKLSPGEPAATVLKANDIFAKTKTERDDALNKLGEATSQLSTAQAEVQKLTTEITAAKKDVETSKTKLTEAETKLSETQTSLKSLTEKLGGRDIDTILGNLKQNEEQVSVLKTEKKIIEDSFAQMKKDLERLQELDRLRSESKAPLELSGKVLAINKAWNFVVLDVGKDDKLVEGVDLTVYRGETLIGKIRTVAVENNTAIADVLPEWTKTEIQVGDKVLF